LGAQVACQHYGSLTWPDEAVEHNPAGFIFSICYKKGWMILNKLSNTLSVIAFYPFSSAPKTIPKLFE